MSRQPEGRAGHQGDAGLLQQVLGEVGVVVHPVEGLDGALDVGEDIKGARRRQGVDAGDLVEPPVHVGVALLEGLDHLSHAGLIAVERRHRRRLGDGGGIGGALGLDLFHRRDKRLGPGGIAEAVGSKLRSWQDYEAGKKVPGSQVIAGLARLGINANWVLTGEGPMLLRDLEHPPACGALDPELLENVIVATRKVLARRGIKLPPRAEARAIRIVYQLCEGRATVPDERSVADVIDLAAYR